MTSSSRALSRRIGRRTVLAGAGALVLAAAGGRGGPAEAGAGRGAALADPEPLTPSPQFEKAFAEAIGGRTPVEGRLRIELPEEAENGNIVPYRIGVESPMTEADHVARVHLLSTQNPQAVVAVFHLTPLSGQAAVLGRMRLARTQEVVALAVTSGGELLVGRQVVHVGIGGCGEG